MTYPATPRADELLGFIRSHAACNSGLAPTFEEMRRALGLKHKSGIYRMLDQLEERGSIRRMPRRARCIEVIEPGTIDLPPDLYRDLARKARGRSVDDHCADILRRSLET